MLFTWNGTTSGVRVPNGDWIADDREGLSFADATSAVFAYDLPWDKIDVATFSWQKVLGGEGAHGVLILGPRAVERLETYTPAWPLPKVFRLVSKGKLAEGVFKGETINTPSMLAVEDAIFALEWGKGLGGAAALVKRSDANAAALNKIVEERDWLGHLAADPAIRSTTSVCLTVEGADEAVIKKMASLLEAEGAPMTWRATATRPRACASGAGRRSRAPISRRSVPGSTGPTRPPRPDLPKPSPRRGEGWVRGGAWPGGN